MKTIKVNLSVTETAEILTKSLQEKGFTIFCDVDHQANAKRVGLDMPASRLLIFGNPIVGTKLMQKDITMSLELPLRLAIVERGDETFIIHKTADDYCRDYHVENHPVLEKVEELFLILVSEI